MKIVLVIFILSFLGTSCNNNQRREGYFSSHERLKHFFQNPNDTLQLPFVGIKDFETREGIAGNSTPYWVVEIKKNRDVYFYFGMIIHQEDGNTKDSLGIYYAGKFKKYIKCDFEQMDNFPRYYEISRDTIYEVDTIGNQLYSTDCCKEINDNPCPCKSELRKSETHTFIYSISHR